VPVLSANGPGAAQKVPSAGPNRTYHHRVATQTQTRPRTEEKPDVESPKPWNVVLIDDQFHSPEYVLEMMQKLFGHSIAKAVEIMETVDSKGRAVCFTTHKEHAELKREQIHSFGPDRLISECVGSMTAVIEPAEFEGDESDEPPRQN
jgi:ATP-dependent Clp protease adaptor protein ClpS